MTDNESGLWFEKAEGGLGFRPLTWQGRASMFGYLLLLVLAVITYSQLFLTVFVVAFYTLAFVGVVIVKSDLMKDRQGPQ